MTTARRFHTALAVAAALAVSAPVVASAEPNTTPPPPPPSTPSTPAPPANPHQGDLKGALTKLEKEIKARM